MLRNVHEDAVSGDGREKLVAIADKLLQLLSGGDTVCTAVVVKSGVLPG